MPQLIRAQTPFLFRLYVQFWNSVARSQNDVPCTTVVRHTEEPLSGARQTAVRADIA